MKVRINHAVNLDEVPEKLTDMMSDIRKEIGKVSELSMDAESASEIVSNSALKYQLVLEMLLEIKRQVSDIDQMVEDMSSILNGYVGILEPKPSTPVPAPEPMPERVTEEPDAD